MSSGLHIYEEILDYGMYLFRAAQKDGADTNWSEENIPKLLEERKYIRALDEVEHAKDWRWEPLRAFLRGIVMGKQT